MLIDALNSFNGETRTLRYVLVPASVAGTIPDPTEEELKRYYDNHQSKFTQPEYPQDRRSGRHARDGQRPGRDHRGRSSGPPTRRTKISSASPSAGRSSRSPSPISTAAKAAYQKIQSGTDFVALAKEQGLSESDIDLGNAGRAELADPTIAEAAFNLEANKVSEPVTGKLGSVVLAARDGDRARQDSDL